MTKIYKQVDFISYMKRAMSTHKYSPCGILSSLHSKHRQTGNENFTAEQAEKRDVPYTPNAFYVHHNYCGSSFNYKHQLDHRGRFEWFTFKFNRFTRKNIKYYFRIISYFKKKNRKVRFSSFEFVLYVRIYSAKSWILILSFTIPLITLESTIRCTKAWTK